MEDAPISGKENKKKKDEGELQDNDINSQSGKKIKLNDGSSQSTPATTEASTAEEQVDSGISLDRSEGMTSDDPTTSQELNLPPNNVVFNAGASINSVRRLLITMSERNYRKHNDHSDDSSSNTELDSDDNMNPSLPSAAPNSSSEPLEIFVGSPMSLPEITTQTSSDESESTDMMMEEDSDSLGDMSDSSDDFLWENRNFNSRDRWMHMTIPSNPVGYSPPPDYAAVVKKPRPKHNWSPVKETLARELGFHSNKFGKSFRYDAMFENKFYGSLHAIYRLENYTKLKKHKGCVNSINFHPEGHLLVSGSDDTNIVIWDWARSKVLQTIRTGHKSNVFQTKFLYHNTSSQINIVTCAKDGQVRLISAPSSGGTASRRKLYSHTRAAHKLHVSPTCPHEVFSAAEDGRVIHADIRTNKHHKLVELKTPCGECVPLFSIHGHPLDSSKFIISGRDKFVRAHDVRKPAEPFATYCPSLFTDVPNTKGLKGLKLTKMYLTCAVYNYDGTEILGSYNDDDVFLFDTKLDAYDSEISKLGYTHRYTGHRNCATFKGVAYFGPESQYVVSGSDCSYIFIWDKKTEAIVQWLRADIKGVVNCVVGHPKHPILASSGLDSDVKIWYPNSESNPTFKGLESAVKLNASSYYRNSFINFDEFADRMHEERDEANVHVNTDACSIM